jgi:hypothetical protein
MKKLIAVLIMYLILVSACRKPEIIRLEDPLPSHETVLVERISQESKTFTPVLDWIWEHKLAPIVVILVYVGWRMNSKSKPSEDCWFWLKDLSLNRLCEMLNNENFLESTYTQIEAVIWSRLKDLSFNSLYEMLTNKDFLVIRAQIRAALKVIDTPPPPPFIHCPSFPPID